jgi:hypothetical protein
MTRRLLLTTALEAQEAKGCAASAVDDITPARPPRVTFYAYFPSCSDPIRALIGYRAAGGRAEAAVSTSLPTARFSRMALPQLVAALAVTTADIERELAAAVAAEETETGQSARASGDA